MKIHTTCFFFLDEEIVSFLKNSVKIYFNFENLKYMNFAVFLKPIIKKGVKALFF